MLDESFAAGTSPVHRMDPRARVLLATAFSILLALAEGWATLTAALGFAIGLVLLARLPLRATIRRLVPLWIFLVLLWLVLPLTHEGAAAAQLGPLTFTRPGILLCARITLKSNAILLALTAWVATMDLATLGHCLHRLRAPDKLVHLMLMTYRYIFVIEAEYRRLVRAARVRGFRPKTNIHTYRTYAYLLGMLFVLASARAERVHQAMRCRGFTGRFHSLHRFETTRMDWVGSAVTLLLMIGLVVLEWKTELPL